MILFLTLSDGKLLLFFFSGPMLINLPSLLPQRPVLKDEMTATQHTSAVAELKVNMFLFILLFCFLNQRTVFHTFFLFLEPAPTAVSFFCPNRRTWRVTVEKELYIFMCCWF